MSLSGVKKTRDRFLFCMSCIYLMAFASLYCQIPGLYSDNGLLPISLQVPKEPKSFGEWLTNAPTLLTFAPRFGLSYENAMDLSCILGIILSAYCIIRRTARDSTTFFLLWILYFSVYQVGQTFLWFQWDILLLEVGFLCSLLAPARLNLFGWSSGSGHPHDRINLWLIRWLLFRLMFMSGVVKLTSDCPTWWSLTALNWHYESQCIPTPLAWFTHQLPHWFHKLSVAATLLIEIPIPFLFLVPIRNVRKFSCVCQIILQVLIILTGNYNFFNLLTIVLCLSLCDDLDTETRDKQHIQPHYSPLKISSLFFSIIIYTALIFGSVHCFSLKIDTENWLISSRLNFTKRQFDEFVNTSVPCAIYAGSISLVSEVAVSLYRSIFRKKGFLKRLRCTTGTLFFSAVGLFIFTASLTPLSHLDQNGGVAAKIPNRARQLYYRVAPFHLVNSYGLFRRMTGVGGRPEVVLEGSYDLHSWTELHFKYKPTAVDGIPPVVAPHQPRLDWQMWFAALGRYEHNPWLVVMVYRLLAGQQEVWQLLADQKYKQNPPKYIRAKLYHYHYTDLHDWRSGSKQWWKRELQREYLPALSLDDPSLVRFVRDLGIIGKRRTSPGSNYLCRLVTWIRKLIGQPDGFKFIMTCIATPLAVKLTLAQDA